VTDERDPLEAFHQQMLIYVAHGPSDHSERPRYYLISAAVVIAIVLAALFFSSLSPVDAPPPTTYPPLTFTTVPPADADGS
jgi:hypothetical protein